MAGIETESWMACTPITIASPLRINKNGDDIVRQGIIARADYDPRNITWTYVPSLTLKAKYQPT